MSRLKIRRPPPSRPFPPGHPLHQRAMEDGTPSVLSQNNASSTSKPHMYSSRGQEGQEQDIRYAAAMPPMHESPQPLSEFSDYTTSTESPNSTIALTATATAEGERVDDGERVFSMSLLKCPGRSDSLTSGSSAPPPSPYLPGQARMTNGNVASRGDSFTVVIPATPLVRMGSTGDQPVGVLGAAAEAGAAVATRSASVTRSLSVPAASLGPAIEAAENALVAAANAASPPPKHHGNVKAKKAAATAVGTFSAAAVVSAAAAAASAGVSPPVRSTNLSSPGVDTKGGVSPSSTSSQVLHKPGFQSSCAKASTIAANPEGNGVAKIGGKSEKSKEEVRTENGGGSDKGCNGGDMGKGDGDAILSTPRSGEGTRRTLMTGGDDGDATGPTKEGMVY